MSGSALVTVSSPGFALGTAVAFASFRACNPWFGGDMIVIASDLDAEDRKLIEAVGSVQFLPPSESLVAAIDALCAARPRLSGRRARFHSLDAYALEGYDRVLFLDSDVVVTGDFEELFARHEHCLAAPDSATLRGERRDFDTFVRTAAADGIATFNAGMIVFNPSALASEKLLDELDPAAWERVEADHTDQLALNRWLAGKATIVGPEYNFMVGHHARGFATAEVPLEAVRMFHFNGPTKPWDLARIVPAAMHSPVMQRAWMQWQRALERVVAAEHFRSR